MARELINLQLFHGQAVFANKLFEPEVNDLMGKPRDRPLYSIVIRFPKTKAVWWEEPALQKLRDACQVIMMREMAGTPHSRVEFPIRDGDLPNNKNNVPEWAKGHWIFRAGTTFDNFKVEQRVNGIQSQITALSIGGRQMWADGDFVGVDVAIAKRMNDNIGIKAYLNGVTFLKKGVELGTGGKAVNWDEAIKLEEQSGFKVEQGGAEFNPGASGGFPGAGAPSGGFPGAGAAPSGGFASGPAPGGFPGGGFNPGADYDKPPF